MKITKILVLVSILLMGCSDDKNKKDELTERIQQLENTNRRLTDSLNKIVVNRIYNTQIIANPEQSDVTPNIPNKLNVLLHSYSSLPKYTVYNIDENDERKIIIENKTEPNFDFDFTPRSNEKTIINLLVVIKFNGEEIEIPSKVIIDPTE